MKKNILAIIVLLAISFGLFSNFVLAAGSVGGPGSNAGANNNTTVGGPGSNTGSNNDTTVGGGNPPDSGTLKNPLKVNSIGDIVNTGLTIFTYLVVLFSVLALIYVGLQLILARGNPAKISENVTWLKYILIGMAIVIGARVMIQIVLNTVESTGSVSPNVINSARNAIK